MTINKLNSHILKEMTLSFRITEEREMASGRKRPGNPVRPHVPSKQKTAPTVSSGPAEISKTKELKMGTESPQESNGEKLYWESFQKPKKAMPKVIPYESPTKTDVEKPYWDSFGDLKKAKAKAISCENNNIMISPTKKIMDNAITKSDNIILGNSSAKQGKFQEKLKKKEDDLHQSVNYGKPKDSELKINKKAIKVPKNNDKTISGFKSNSKVKMVKIVPDVKSVDDLPIEKQPGKLKDSGLKIAKKSSKKQAITFPKNNGKTVAEFKDAKKINNSKVTKVKAVAEKQKKVNGSKAQAVAVPKINGFAEQTSSEDNSDLEDFELNSEAEEGRSSENNPYNPSTDSEEFDGFEDEDEDFFRAPKIITVKLNNQTEGLPFQPPVEPPTANGMHFLEDACDASVRKISLFESARDEMEDTDDEYVPQNSEDFESEDFESEETDSEDFDSEDYESEDSEDFDDDDDSESDSEDFDSDIFDSDDLDSTYEPPNIEGFFDDTPPHLQKEPLIIEEIFDELPEPQILDALVKYKPNGEKIAEDDIAAKTKIAKEPKITVEAKDWTQFPQSNDSPFYRNPHATSTELSVFENSLKSNYVLAVIKEDIELYGTLVLTLLSGEIGVNGHRARKQEPLTIYSLKGLPWVIISPMKTKKPAKDEVNWEELNENFTRAQLDRIQGSFQSQKDAIVLLQRNAGAQRLLETFGKHMAQNVFPLLNTPNRPHEQSESLLQCLIQNSDLTRTLRVPQVWNKLKIQPNTRIMITGGKGVGKSNMLRYLINRNLDHIPSFLLVDLDIGQPEIFVPQTVSCTLIDQPLLGPGFLLNKQPDCAYVVGHTNIIMCATQYARAVIQLMQHIQNDPKYANIPWLINTMGYNKGFGTELMALMVDRIRPTDLVQISSPMAINNFDSPLEWSILSKCKPIIFKAAEFRVREIPKYALHQLTSVVPPKDPREKWSFSAKDMRYANLLARLSSCLTGNAKSLADCQTLGVPLDALKVQHPTNKDYTREELIDGMEANVVYLCHQEANGLPQCLGLGIVRAIDYELQKLFLVPAMPLQRMSLVNSLILGGELTLPQGFFRDQGQEVSSSVPFVFILDDSKSSKSIQQIYHRSPAFLGVPANQRNEN